MEAQLRAQRLSISRVAWVRDVADASSNSGPKPPSKPFHLRTVTQTVRASIAYEDTSEYLNKLEREHLADPEVATLLLDTNRRVQLSWQDIEYTVKSKDPVNGLTTKRKLLDNLTGTVKPGRLMAIMGPSGAGKTTLLHVLAKKIHSQTLSGQILYNGAPVTEKLMQTSMGFVAQEDILLGSLTPYEVLEFVSRLRQPNGISDDRRRAKILALLKSMGLEHVKDSLIGFTGSAAANSGIKRGLSGGERKRVSICVELVHEPAVLMLDEPTSGLDSYAAKIVVEGLRRLAFTGRTIVCSIHQPSAEIFRLFDDLCLLAQGQVAYQGPAHLAVSHFESLGYTFPKFINPADYMMKLLFVPPESEIFNTATTDDLEAGPAGIEKQKLLGNVGTATTDNQVASLVAAYKTSKIAKKINRKSQHFNPDAQSGIMDRQAQYESAGGHAGLLLQLWLLIKREWTHALRDPVILRARLGQAIGSALLMGLIFLRTKPTQSGISDRLSVLYFLLAGAVVAGTTAPVYVFPTERAVVQRDRSSRLYNPVMYFLSLLSVETPLNILYPTITSVVAYWMINFGDSASAMLALIVSYVLTQIASHALGMVISSIIWNSSVAVKMQPMVLAYTFLFSGFYIRETAVPVFFIWLDKLDFLKYGFRAASSTIFGGQKYDCVGETFCRDPDGDSLLRRLDFLDKPVWADWLILLAFCVGLYTISVLFLVFKKR